MKSRVSAKSGKGVNEQAHGLQRISVKETSGVGDALKTGQLEKTEGQVVQDSHNTGGVPKMQTAAVFIQGHITAVMKAVLDMPVSASDVEQSSRGSVFEMKAGQAIEDFM